jgi:hypothetical protein
MAISRDSTKSSLVSELLGTMGATGATAGADADIILPSAAPAHKTDALPTGEPVGGSPLQSSMPLADKAPKAPRAQRKGGAKRLKPVPVGPDTVVSTLRLPQPLHDRFAFYAKHIKKASINTLIAALVEKELEDNKADIKRYIESLTVL